MAMPPPSTGRLVFRPVVEPLEGRDLPSGGPQIALPAWDTVTTASRSDRILVRFRAEPFALPGTSVAEALGAVHVVRLGEGQTVAEAVAAYRADPRVEFAQPDYLVRYSRMPNDPSFAAQWGLHNTGQGGGVAGADINILPAWNVNTGQGRIIVAVIDTGVDYRHPDLAANIWRNPGEIPNNGLDDDGNGYVDDVHGYDFANDDPDPMDDNGHGTHVAGIIGAIGNNRQGVAGIVWNLQIMPLKFLGADGTGYTSDAVRALRYAVANGARISNNSWAGNAFDLAMLAAIRQARDAGHIVVAAAGNGGRDLDFDPVYPAGYDADNVVAVAALTRRDALASFSNYGRSSVHLAAPGANILSTTPGGTYSYYSGTSMAAPHVTGVMALLWDLHPQWHYQQVISQVLQTVTPLPALRGRTLTGGRVNAGQALSRQGVVSHLPRVLEAQPIVAADGSVDRVRIRMSKPVDPASFTAEDIVGFQGPDGPISGVTVVVVPDSGNGQFDVAFPVQTAAGVYQFRLGPQIHDFQGGLMDQDADGIGGEPGEDTFVVSFRVRPRHIFDAQDVDKPIPDMTRTVSYLIVDRDLTIRDADVRVHVSHSYVGDLRIRLIAPSGQRIPLIVRRGGSGDNLEQTVFDDEARAFIGSSAAPFAGEFRPERPLSTLNGTSARGRWELWIDDLAHGDSGWLHSWSLVLSPVRAAGRQRTQEQTLRRLPGPEETAVLFGRSEGPWWRKHLAVARLVPEQPERGPLASGNRRHRGDGSQYPLQDLQGRRHMLRSDAQRRAEADGAFAASQKQQPLAKRPVHDAIAELGRELAVREDIHGDHQA
jgi:subtilisin family serine protease/subtilisin-like proprotein convertase family protein